ncbi:MAG: M20/M25/M40 family metallo-hydrolase [Oscillospiraceae bacterium]|nr:M20/M25/M40 family metallo-hydrolase [Oscillospiraceae bacterium]MDD4369042.1 M20/M25/M40 family metallo-hydrolase [Oscillospiraceae bacterium]
MSVNQARLVQTFSDLVAIDALSFEEREMADYLKKVWQETCGVTLQEDGAAAQIGGNAGNLFGRLSGDPGRPELLLSAHMDTVAPGRGKKAVVQADGRITSAGNTVLGADDAAALAIILEACRELTERQLSHRPLELLFTVAEEAYARGAAVFDLSQIEAKLAYCLDCSDRLGAYSAQEPTLLSFELTVHGQSAHAGFKPEAGVNAVACAAAAIARLPQGWQDPHTTFNIGRIEGGTATNIVPDTVTVKGEIRSAVHEDALACWQHTVAVFEAEAAQIGASISVSQTLHLTAYQIEASNPALRDYQAVLARRGLEAYAKPSFGGSDNNILVQQGFSGLCLFNPMHDIHTTHEYTQISELTAMTELLIDLLTL